MCNILFSIQNKNIVMPRGIWGHIVMLRSVHHTFALWAREKKNHCIFFKLSRPQQRINPIDFCPPPFTKAGDIKTHMLPSVLLSVRPSVRLSVTKTLTLLISSAVLMIEHWYLACIILVTSPFNWHHAVTLTFDLPQCQSCCRAGTTILRICLWKSRSQWTDGNNLCNMMEMKLLSIFWSNLPHEERIDPVDFHVKDLMEIECIMPKTWHM